MIEALVIFFIKMGWLSTPLFAMGCLGWYQVMVLLDFFRRESIEKEIPSPQEFVRKKLSEECQTDASLLKRYLYLLQNTRKADLESTMLEFQRREISPLKEGLSHIRIACAVSPLLGLLGTINGIAAVFTVVSGYGSGNFVLFSDGISEALLTTQTGLIIAFPLLLSHTYVKTKLDGTCKMMQIYTDFWLKNISIKKNLVE